MSAKKQVNIIIECPEFIPSVKVGVYNILKFLESKSICNIKFLKTKDIRSRDIEWSDVLVTVRGSEYKTNQVVRVAKEHKRKVIYFLDDDILDIPENIASTDYYKHPDILKNINEILCNSDLLWCVNHRLGEKYSQIANIPWFLSKVPMVFEHINTLASSSEIKFIYAGSKDHFKVVQTYLLPAIDRMIENYGHKVKFYIIGANPKELRKDQIVCFDYFNSYEEYKHKILEISPDVGLAPILTDNFYTMKYHNKYIEYASAGAVGIFSNTMPYSKLITHDINGFLCDNSVNDWYCAMENIVLEMEHLEMCKKHVLKDLKENYNYERIAEELLQYLDDYMNYKAPVVKIRSTEIDSTIIMYIRKTINLIKEEKIGGVIKILKKLIFKMMKKRG